MAQDKDHKTPNVPPLRFPGFTDEWKRVKVSDLLEFYSTNSLSWDMLNYDAGNIRNLHYGLIHSGLPTLIDLNKDSLPFVNETSMPKKFTLCKEGDVAFADASEDTNDVGKAVEFVDLNSKTAICGLHTIHGRDKSDQTVLGFKGYAFASTAFHNQIRRIAQGTKIYSISTKTFDEVSVAIPSKEEQVKIARLLRIIDERIATQNKIIDNLQSLIKGIRERIFKAQNTRYANLGDIAKLYQPQTISTSDLEEDGLYVVYGANGVIGHYHSYNHERPQICITCRGNTCGQVTLTSPFSWITGNAMVINIEGNKEIDQSYLFHFLTFYNFTSIISGSGQPQIVRTPLEKIKVPFPPLEEQLHIANILNSLSNRLDNENVANELYNRQKGYLLRQLFI